MNSLYALTVIGMILAMYAFAFAGHFVSQRVLIMNSRTRRFAIVLNVLVLLLGLTVLTASLFYGQALGVYISALFLLYSAVFFICGQR